MEIPASLRAWFVVHSLVDIAVAVPLLLAPEALLPRFGWQSVDPVASRLVAAALLAIGVQSWRGRNDGAAAYRAMLALKVVWSAAAIVALTIAIGRGAPPLTFGFLAMFLGFCGVWTYYAIRLRQLAQASDDPPEQDLAEGDTTEPT
ncbi:MAG: hypothetical protein ABUS79_15570 [Pseudomonadota bacterium]